MITTLIVVVPIAVCILISFLAKSILYKIVFLGLGMFLASTLGLAHFNILLKESINKSKKTSKQTNKTNNTKSKQEHKPKIVKNEDYQILVSTLKECMKNKLLNREQILDFKNVLNEHLGSHKDNYKKFKFENDLHEFYVKLKNDVLTSQDYQEMLLVLNNYKN